ncbi:hypothetical protein E2C01_066185 [Portunus trituberculatus]|uniref:Uncharacterized protein n=1 Tax=Portunus trituberculatus TaxID=210409 RepID=A0A5B7HU00_PORTR|nr:hypothetical protein [Portunus trituberculatus]
MRTRRKKWAGRGRGGGGREPIAGGGL